jgi:hypothetical protein
LGGSAEPSAADDVGGLDHDGVVEHLVADYDRRQHRRVGVPGARIAEPVDRQRSGGLGQEPVAEQRLVGVGQDHPLVVGVVLDLFPEPWAGSIRQPTALAARARQLVEIHGHATLTALHPADHRRRAQLLLEANGHRPGLEHVL